MWAPNYPRGLAGLPFFKPPALTDCSVASVNAAFTELVAILRLSFWRRTKTHIIVGAQFHRASAKRQNERGNKCATHFLGTQKIVLWLFIVPQPHAPPLLCDFTGIEVALAAVALYCSYGLRKLKELANPPCLVHGRPRYRKWSFAPWETTLQG